MVYYSIGGTSTEFDTKGNQVCLGCIEMGRTLYVSYDPCQLFEKYHLFYTRIVPHHSRLTRLHISTVLGLPWRKVYRQIPDTLPAFFTRVTRKSLVLTCLPNKTPANCQQASSSHTLRTSASNRERHHELLPHIDQTHVSQ